MLNSRATFLLLCSVGFQPEMALVMHLIYGGLKLKKIVYPKRNGVCTYYGAKSTFFNNGPFRLQSSLTATLVCQFTDEFQFLETFTTNLICIYLWRLDGNFRLKLVETAFFKNSILKFLETSTNLICIYLWRIQWTFRLKLHRQIGS